MIREVFDEISNLWKLDIFSQNLSEGKCNQPKDLQSLLIISNEIKEKKQSQRFLECLNYVFDYFKDLRIICELLYKRLRKNVSTENKSNIRLVKQFMIIRRKSFNHFL